MFICWSKAHVGKEVFKTVTPTFTNRDSSTAVILPSGMIGVGAAIYHRRPYVVFRSMVVLQGVPVSTTRYSCSGCANFPTQTPTTFNDSRPKTKATSDKCIAAIARTNPKCLVFFVTANAVFDEKSPESLASYILKSSVHHRAIITSKSGRKWRLKP